MPKEKDDNLEESSIAEIPETGNYGVIKSREISDEISQSYLDYAMSVIVGRALPDVRDGMKPVHRRILYAMNDIGLRSTAKFRKSATVVGEVLGKYHPHGDVAVYDSMVRMAQDFSLRYPLIQGQGNFGSMDGDSAAAMRYTEARMSKISEEVVADIDKDTIDFIPNYDGSHKEPVVLPSKVPNLLLNGSEGIAVGMATKIPPHNLSELVDATTHLIDNPECSVDDLINFVPGPDFPTGGSIFNAEEIRQAYTTGKGNVVMRGEAKIEEGKKGDFKIIITEIPFQVNKASLVEKIATLVKDKKLVGISDLRDESDRDGVRVVVELKKDAYPQKILNSLYKMTQLQESFHMNVLALVDGIQPKVLNLKETLEYYVKHRQEVIVRRTQFELKKAKDRLHILEGLKIALDHLDAVISTIRASKTKEEAKENLIKKFKLSDIQAQAILDMRLSALAALERKKIEDEYKEVKKLIDELEAILSSDKKILGIIKDEMAEMKEKYGDERRTRIFKKKIGEFRDEDLVPNEEVIVTLSEGNYIKRIPASTYKTQGRGGTGIIGATTKEEDTIAHLSTAMTHDHILFFTNKGRVFQTRVFEVPAGSRIGKGQAIVNLLSLSGDEKVTSLITLKDFKLDGYMFMTTKKGVVKKTEIINYQNVRKSGIIAIKIDDGDELDWVKCTSGKDEVLIVSAMGMSIHFKEDDVRPMGRASRGVRGIKLRENDFVVGVDVVSPDSGGELLVISQNGLGKRTSISEYNIQNRGGIGIKTANVTDKTGSIVGARIINQNDNDLLCISKEGQVIRVPLKTISKLGRSTQGVKVMRLKPGDTVASMSIISGGEEDTSEENSGIASEATVEKDDSIKAQEQPGSGGAKKDEAVALSVDDGKKEKKQKAKDADIKPTIKKSSAVTLEKRFIGKESKSSSNAKSGGFKKRKIK